MTKTISPTSFKQRNNLSDSKNFQARVNTPENIAVLLPSALTESFEIVLARIVDLCKEGFTVKVIYCNALVKGCVANPFGFKLACHHCCYVRDYALTKILGSFSGISLDSHYTNKCNSYTDLCEETKQSLKNGVHSTILTFYRRDVEQFQKLSLRGMLYRSLARRYMFHSQFTYQAISNIIKKESISRLEFFNGRIIPTRAAIQAANQAAIDFSAIEVSGQKLELFTTKNELVHDIQYNQRSLREFIDMGLVNQRLGEDFFESRRKGLVTDARSFIQHQKSGNLYLNDRRPILAIFTSSDDELRVAGDQWFTSASMNPIGFVIKIANLLNGNYRIIVRMHPNQAGDRTGAASEMQKTLSRYPNIELIKPNDIQSTYELIDEAKAVLTFGSTVGLEATFWGKPSILCGRAVWDQLDIAYRAESPDEVKLLLSGVLLPKSKTDAISAGSYYMAGHGANGSLSWQPNGITGFAVNGQSFLPKKRSAFGYWSTRVVDRILRLV